MRPEEVNPYPTEGVWYALHDPLCLVRYLPPKSLLPYEVPQAWEFGAWLPSGRTTLMYMPPVKIRRLWYERPVLLNNELADYRPGDVVLCKRNDRLFFVVPPPPGKKSNNTHYPSHKTVYFAADWEMGEKNVGDFTTERVMLFQRGPDREPEDPGFETRFDKVNHDDRPAS